MKDQELINALREHAEWARANEWETPITLGDDLAEAADRIEAQAKEIEKLRAQLPRWIPVEERLPEYGSEFWQPICTREMIIPGSGHGKNTRTRQTAAGMMIMAGGMRVMTLHTGCRCRRHRR